MSRNGNRRRLKKLALEYVRPGVRVGDLNAALIRIQHQRVLWHRFVAEGAIPEVPGGIGDVQVAFQQVSQDLAALDEPLGLTGRDSQLDSVPIESLVTQDRGPCRRIGCAAQSAGPHGPDDGSA